MPSIDLIKVVDYPTFERAYFELLDVINEELTEDHLFELSDKSLLNTLYPMEGAPAIGPEPTESRDDFRAVEINDDGSVTLIRPSRGKPDGWAERFELDRAMASTLIGPIVSVARQFASRNPGAAPAEVRKAETVRLLRVLDDDWADEYAEHGYFLDSKSTVQPD